MSKKNKKNLQQLLEKRRALQQIGSVSTISPKKNEPVSTVRKIIAPVQTTTTVDSTVEALVEQPKVPNHHSREIFRTLVSVLIITIVLIGAIILDKRSDVFTTFGNWLYSSLKLKG